MSVSSKKLLAGIVPDQVPTDEYWNDVQLLLNGDKGTDGDNNTTFTGATITGSPDAANVNPYGAHYFDFTGGELDILETASEFTFGTGDFTVELWARFDTLASSREIVDWRNAAGAQTGYPALFTSVTSFSWFNGTSTILSSTITQNTWYHFAVARESGTIRLFVDGAQVDSASDTTNYLGVQDNLHIGGLQSQFFIDGKLSNLRIVKGTALYTAAFTPPRKTLTDVTGTSLLTFVNGALVDYSSEAHEITTAAGVITANPGGPLNKPYDENAGSIVYPNGTSGNTNYIRYAGAQTGMGTNFTIECWVYPYTLGTSYATNNVATILDTDRTSGNSTADWWHLYQNGSAIKFGSGVSGSATEVGSWASVLSGASQWHHLLMTYNGTNLELFVNGVSQGTVAWASGSSGTGTRDLYVGKQPGQTRYVRGLISDVRLSDTVRETADFTPPTAPLTSDANTTKLIQFNEAACGDLTGRAIVTEAGDAQMDTAIFKYGTGSLLFDGTGDYLQATVEAPGTGDFTIECWARFDSVSPGEGLFQLDATLGDAIQGPAAGYSNGGGNVWYMYAGANQFGGTNTPSSGTWYHVAYVRSSGVSKLYIDGVEEISIADTTNYTDTNINIGGWYSTSFLLDGNIDDFRYTKGVARYTGSFTPPERAAETRQT